MPLSSDPDARRAQLANLDGTKHGAKSEVVLAPLRERYAVELAQTFPSAARAEIVLLAHRQAELDVLESWMDQRGLLSNRQRGTGVSRVVTIISSTPACSTSSAMPPTFLVELRRQLLLDFESELRCALRVAALLALEYRRSEIARMLGITLAELKAAELRVKRATEGPAQSC